MASAISTAFQGDVIDEQRSFHPSRRAPSIPSVAYANTVPSRAPELGERPIHQTNTAEHRLQQQQHIQSQSQYHPGFESATSHPQQQAFPPHHHHSAQSSTSFSRPQAPSRGRQHAETSESRAEDASPQSQPQPSPFPVPPSSLQQISQPKKRSGSFSFLRRSSSHQASNRVPQAAPAPGIVAQPRPSVSSHQPQPSDGSITSNSTSLFRARSRDGKSGNMLRKQSKMKAQQQQAESERQQRLSEVANRPPPRLPQHAPLPGIDAVVDDEHKLSSSHTYTDPNAPPPLPDNAARANFSRLGMASSGHDSSSSPAYAVRASDSASLYTNGGDYYEPSGERSASMTNRGRYSYASSTAQTGNVNSPRRVRRRKDPTPFNVLVIGTKNSGKSSFISFLRNSLALRSDRQDQSSPAQPPTRATFTSQYLETEIDGERVGVTLWDSAGFEKNVVDLQLREMTSFMESKFEETFNEEQKVIRSPGFQDTHIHCVFLVLDPVRLDTNVLANATGNGAGGLDEDVDLQVLRALWGKTTVIPVISKADTLTINHMNFLKRAVWQSVKGAKLNPLDALELDDDDEEFDEEDEDGGRNNPGASLNGGGSLGKAKRPGHARQASLSSTISDEDPYIPMSILSPDPYSMPPYTKYAPRSQSEIGRRYAWGFASPFDPQHCDFIRLRDTIFSEWRVDLRELSRVKWYEQWRTSRLRHAPQSKPRSKINTSVSQPIPIRESTNIGNPRHHHQQSLRDLSGATSQNVPRTVAADGQSTPGAQPADVGMAVTTPNGMDAVRH